MIYKRGKWYWMDVAVNDTRYREPLNTKNWQEAKTREKERLLEIAQSEQRGQARNKPSAPLPTPTLKREPFIPLKKPAGRTENAVRLCAMSLVIFR